MLDDMRLTRRILYAHYGKSELSKVVSEIKPLTEEERAALYTLLTKYEFLLDGTLVTWDTTPIDIELHPYDKPYHEKPYRVPRSHEATFNKFEQLCQLEVITFFKNIPEWGTPNFIQPKNNVTVRLLSNLGN